MSPGRLPTIRRTTRIVWTGCTSTPITRMRASTVRSTRFNVVLALAVLAAGAAAQIGPSAGAASGGSGQRGPQGPAGNSVLNGVGAPASTLGNNGDFYLRTDTTCLYGPKNSGAWPGTCQSLVGPAGAAGQTGPAGPAGSMGQPGPAGPAGSFSGLTPGAIVAAATSSSVSTPGAS